MLQDADLIRLALTLDRLAAELALVEARLTGKVVTGPAVPAPDAFHHAGSRSPESLC